MGASSLDDGSAGGPVAVRATGCRSSGRVRRQSAKRKKAMGMGMGGARTPSRRGTLALAGSRTGTGNAVAPTRQITGWVCTSSGAGFNVGIETLALSQKSRQFALSVAPCGRSEPPWCEADASEASAVDNPACSIAAVDKHALATPAPMAKAHASSTRAVQRRSCCRWRNMVAAVDCVASRMGTKSEAAVSVPVDTGRLTDIKVGRRAHHGRHCRGPTGTTTWRVHDKPVMFDAQDCRAGAQPAKSTAQKS